MKKFSLPDTHPSPDNTRPIQSILVHENVCTFGKVRVEPQGGLNPDWATSEKLVDFFGPKFL